MTIDSSTLPPPQTANMIEGNIQGILSNYLIATEYTDNSADKDYVPRPQVGSPNIKAGDLDGNGPFKLNT